MANSNSPILGKAALEERERMMILKQKFEKRITCVKFGKQCLDAGDYSSAIQRFTEYMNIMAEIKGSEDSYGLKVSHFDPSKDVTELLMISHIFFEMARIYDAVPKFHNDSARCLEQFVHFSVNQPFQVVNSELVRKHLKKSVFKNPDVFRSAYQQIFVQSKKCYVVTFCYGDDHPITQEFRLFKDWLLQSGPGQEVVRLYYTLSSRFIQDCENKQFMKITGQYLVRPLLLLFSKTVLPLILRKC
jgi:hypothetical protein